MVVKTGYRAESYEARALEALSRSSPKTGLTLSGVAAKGSMGRPAAEEVLTRLGRTGLVDVPDSRFSGQYRLGPPSENLVEAMQVFEKHGAIDTSSVVPASEFTGKALAGIKLMVETQLVLQKEMIVPKDRENMPAYELTQGGVATTRFVVDHIL